MWAVRYEAMGLIGAAFGATGLVKYRYFRWRWRARLSAWMFRQPMPGPLVVVTDARMLGRVRLLPPSP